MVNGTGYVGGEIGKIDQSENKNQARFSIRTFSIGTMRRKSNEWVLQLCGDA